MEASLDTRGRRGVELLPLLLWLFVVEAAADCQSPQGTGNIVLTNEALLLNDFPEGSVVTLECAKGHVRESGSGITNCVGGKWSEPDLICKKMDCGLPKPQPNMSFNLSAGTLYGAVINVICDKGYQISGSGYKQCFVTGWSRRAKCDIVTCDLPAEVANGKRSWDSTDYPKYGETINYTCADGYTLVGNDRIMCDETGEYDSQPPECLGVTTEDSITTKMVTSTPPAQDSSTAPTALRDKAITTSATSTVSRSTREMSTSTDTSTAPTDRTTTPNATPTVSHSARGGTDILIAEDKTTTASVTSTSSPDRHGVTVDISKDIGHAPVIFSVICISLAVCILVFFLYKFLLRRKGSVNGTEPIC